MPGDDRELLIRVDERVEHLTRLFENFVKTSHSDIAAIKECHDIDMSKLWTEIGTLKTKINMAHGAVGLLFFILTTAVAILW